VAAKIISLDEETVKKIAAGEVIERPASAVKELIENSIDANSTRITIEVSGGGKKLIEITDNGEGMNREDASRSFKRYSTSKIRRIEDLDRLGTLGFRGEALASICAVGRLELVTKTRGSVQGTQVLVEGSDLKSAKDIGCPEGTTVVVRDLFFNLPARRKHLKSVRRELAHVIDIVTRYSLIRNDIYFSLSHEDRKIMESPPTGNMLDAVTNIFGRAVSQSLIPLKYGTKRLIISGLVGKPYSTRSSPNMQFIYVNGRYVSSRLVSRAIREAYGTLLPKNRYPICVIAMEISPGYIDVNIHPTKLQVKFVNESEVYESVVAGVKAALGSEPLTPDTMPKRVERKQKAPMPGFARAAKPSKFAPLTIESYRKRFREVPEKAQLPELKIIGDYDNTYILGESSKGMVVLDQHAAHERVLYERLMNKRRDTQELIAPITLELSAKESAVLEDFSENLVSLGFGFEPFGKNTQRISSVPVVLGSLVSPDVIHDILNDMATLPKAPEKSVEERIAQIVATKSAMAACKGAIKAGEKQSTERLQRLVKDLYESSNPYTCPHGRPTMIFITKEELEKRFLRT
jgi:DNA mismatch repair protein MutL